MPEFRFRHLGQRDPYKDHLLTSVNPNRHGFAPRPIKTVDELQVALADEKCIFITSEGIMVPARHVVAAWQVGQE